MVVAEAPMIDEDCGRRSDIFLDDHETGRGGAFIRGTLSHVSTHVLAGAHMSRRPTQS